MYIYIVKVYLIVCLMFITLCAKGQTITTIAGGGTVIADGGLATDAILNGPNGGAFDKHGYYYLCEVLSHKVRKISPLGIITIVAGTGAPGSMGDGGPATAAELKTPTDVFVDPWDNVFISDLNNFKIRKIDGVTGFISTVAGTGVAGFNGDGILATTAMIQGNEQIWIDKLGSLFICDRDNFRIRKVSSAGIISTIAGGGFSATGTGDGGPATNATFNLISGIAVDDTGSIFIADYNSAKVRKVDTFGIITTIAGNGSPTYFGDGILATDAQFAPLRLTFDRSKNLIIADKYNRRILRIDNSGIIHNIVGNGMGGLSGDGGAAIAASIDFPAGIVYDTCGNLYIADVVNKRVRKVLFNPVCAPIGVPAIDIVKRTISTNPNPAEYELTVTSPETISSVSVMNMLGQSYDRITFTENKNEVVLDIRHLSHGIYVIHLTDMDGRKSISKFVKE